MFLLMCTAPASWLGVAHQFLGLTFPLCAFAYISSTLWFNREWLPCKETAAAVLAGLGGAARAANARLEPQTYDKLSRRHLVEPV